MTPIIPFEPARTAVGHTRAALADAYSADAIRSFVQKLRQLGAEDPETCEEVLAAMDHLLGGMLTTLSTGDTRILDGLRVMVKLNDLNRPGITHQLELIIDDLAPNGGAR